MDDAQTLADREFAQLCKTVGLPLNEECRRLFRLGFMAGRLHEMNKTLSQLGVRDHATG